MGAVGATREDAAASLGSMLGLVGDTESREAAAFPRPRAGGLGFFESFRPLP